MEAQLTAALPERPAQVLEAGWPAAMSGPRKLPQNAGRCAGEQLTASGCFDKWPRLSMT